MTPQETLEHIATMREAEEEKERRDRMPMLYNPNTVRELMKDKDYAREDREFDKSN